MPHSRLSTLSLALEGGSEVTGLLDGRGVAIGAEGAAFWLSSDFGGDGCVGDRLDRSVDPGAVVGAINVVVDEVAG